MALEYEPESAIEIAFQTCRARPHVTRVSHNWLKISDVKRTVNTEFEKSYKPEMAAATLRRNGHEVSRIDGYPAVNVS